MGPIPYALCQIVPHVTDKGYILYGFGARAYNCILFFKLVSKLAEIALINSLDDLMLSPGEFVEAENPPLARAAAGTRAGTKN